MGFNRTSAILASESRIERVIVTSIALLGSVCFRVFAIAVAIETDPVNYLKCLTETGC